MKLVKYLITCFLIIFLVSGCAEKGVEEEAEVPEGVEEERTPIEEKPMPQIVIKLTSDKVMVPNEIEISKGNMLKWVNEDTNFNHNLVIYSAAIERPSAKDIIVQSGNIAPGGSWDYTFEEAGKYKIRDIYSGTMRGEVTAEVTAELISEGKDVGTVIVE
jgi:plastocyanin